jgi:hypothetical protein
MTDVSTTAVHERGPEALDDRLHDMGLQIIDHAASSGALRELYERMLARPLPPAYRPAHGGVAGIITAHSLDPALLPRVFACSSTLNGAGPLSWPERELVNATTSRLNQCLY